jgi:hypothetical protein
MSGELIGAVDLLVDADLTPLDAALPRAERKVATSVAIMQALLDKLHVSLRDDLGGLDARLSPTLAGLGGSAGAMAAKWTAALGEVKAAQDEVAASVSHTAEVAVAASEVQVASSHRVTAAYLEQAAAARAAAEAGDAALARSIGGDALGAVLGSRGGGGVGAAPGRDLAALAALEGVRGKGHVGGRSNPLVVVLEAGRYTSLGGMAAAIGENSIGGGPGAQAATPGVGPAPVATSQPQRSTVAGGSAPQERDRAAQDAALASAVAALEDLKRSQAAQSKGSPSAVVLGPSEGKQGQRTIILPSGVQSKGSGGEKAVPVILTDAEPKATGALTDAAMIEAVRGISGGASPSAVAGALGGAAGAGGHSGGGGGFPPWLTALLWGHAGGGGGGGYKGGGIAGRALVGAAGLGAGVGSLGSFAGFGPEHIILTLGGIAGSGAAALGGGALLGAGALGKFAVGGGSDLAVGASAVADTKTLFTQYEKLREAVAHFGKASTQAKKAQAELGAIMKYNLSGTAGVAAELKLAEQVSALNVAWDKGTSGARIQFAKLGEEAITVAKTYLPLVAHAAEQNFGAIAQDIKPFFSWLKGPEAIGIFLELENEFRNEIPTAMAALDQGFQFFAKTIAYTAPLTGAFLRDLDRFFTKWNTPSEFSVWEGEMNKLITDFHVWGAFIKILGEDLVDLFDKDAHTGEGIIETLTHMLDKVHEYENSVAGSKAIHNIFVVHKAEAIALLEALVPLIGAFSHIYTTVSPPLVEAVTNIAEAFTKVVTAIEKAGALGTWVIGLGLIAAKLKLLVPLLKAAGVETGLLTAAEDKNAAAGGLDAAAQGGLAGTTGLAGASAYERAMGAQEGSDALAAAGLTAKGGGLAALLSKSNLLKAGIYGAGGLIGGSLLASATGAKGTLASGLQAGGAGAGVGFVLGPAAGALIGTEIAPGLGTALGAGIGFAAPYVVKALTSLFASSTSKAEEAVRASNAQKSSRIIGSLGSALLPPSSSEARRGEVNKALDAASKYAAQRAESGGIATRSLRVDRRAIAAGNARDTAEELREYEKAGAAAMLGFREGFTHGEDPTRFAFVADGLKVLKTFPPQARAVGAKAMIEYAAELEAKKTLPQGAMRSVIQAIEHEFPQLANYIKAQGFETAKGFTAAMKLTEAETNTKTTLHSIEQHFDLMGLNVGTAMKDLEYIIAHTTGEQNKIAKEKLSELTYDNAHQWDAMTAKVKQSAHEQATAIHNLSTELPILGAPGYEKYVGLVQKWAEGLSERVTAGVESLHTGISQINKMLEGELSALGAPKEIAANLITGKGGINLRGGLGKGVPLEEGQPVPGAAQGALFQIGAPGAGGRDTVGLNVGGLPIAVGAGEQVAVFNRHQQPIVNDALAAAGYGGLPGLFNAVSTPNYMASGGLIPDVVHAGLSDIRHAEKSKLARAHAASASSGAGGIAGHFSGSWVQVMEGIAKEEGWSLADWEKIIAHESGGRVSVKNPTSTAFGLGQLLSENYAVYGGGPGSSGVEQIIAMARYIKAHWGNPTRGWESEERIGTYGLGGLLSFTGGGLVPGFSKGSASVPKKAKKVPKKAKKVPKTVQTWKVHPFGKIGSLATTWSGQVFYDKLNSLLGEGGPVSQGEESYSLASRAAELALSDAPHEGAFIISPNTALGESGSPFIDEGNVNLRKGQLGNLEGIEGGVLEDLNQAWVLSTTILASLSEAISDRNHAIAELKARVEANLKKIEEARDRIQKREDELHRLEQELSGLPTGKHATPATRDQAKKLHERAGKIKGDIGTDQTLIKTLEGENVRLGGDGTGLGSGGKIGVLDNQVSDLSTAHDTVTGDRQTIGGSTGRGGSRGTISDTLIELAKQTRELGGEALKVKLAEAGTGSSGGAESSLELAEREKVQLEEKLKIKTQENLINTQALSVFGGTGDIGEGAKNAFAAAATGGMFGPLARLPYAGSFDMGGTIPGPWGAPAVAVVHGGEKVRSNRDQEEPAIVINQQNNMLHPGDPKVLLEVGKAATRGMRLQGTRPSKRLTPGI